MKRKLKPVKTFHFLDMADSLREQGQFIFSMICAAETVMKLNPDLHGGSELRRAVDECRAAMYPEEN